MGKAASINSVDEAADTEKTASGYVGYGGKIA